MAIEHAVYTAQATSTGGRTGTTTSSDGEINLSLMTPKQLGGPGARARTPSSCLLRAIRRVSSER